MQKEKGSKYILIIVILALLVPMAFMAGTVLTSSLQDSFLLSADSLSSWVSALATVAIAVLTFILAKETWYLREAQSAQLEQMQRDSIKPHIDFSLVHSRVDFHFMEMKIANYGSGVAKNIKFSLLHGSDEFPASVGNPIVVSIFERGAVLNGISNLGIGQVYKTFIFSFLDVINEIGEKEVFSTRFSIEIIYHDMHGFEYRDVVFVDMSSFSGVVEVGGGDPSYKISKSLEKMTAWMEGLTRSSGRRISVDAYSQTDRERERAIQQAQYRDRQATAKQQNGLDTDDG